jgi:hypothetical protein
MTTFIYRCRTTALNVQGWIADDPSANERDTYHSVTCLACRQIHLVNPTSGKALSDDDDKAAAVSGLSIGLFRSPVAGFESCSGRFCSRSSHSQWLPNIFLDSKHSQGAHFPHHRQRRISKNKGHRWLRDQ